MTKRTIAVAFLAVAVLTACSYTYSNVCEPAQVISQPHAIQAQQIQPAPKHPSDTLAPPADSPSSDPETTKETVSGENYLTEIENQVMDLINKERLSLGLNELEFDPRLQNAARIRSKELCQSEEMQKQKLSHVRPDGSEWHTVLTKDIPIPGLVAAGEILARECTTDGTSANQDPIPAKDWFLLWKSSKSHYDNITWPEAQRVGVGIYYEVRDGNYYTNATVLFGIFAEEENTQKTIQN